MRFGVLGDAKIAREKLPRHPRRGPAEVTHVARRDRGAGVNEIWGDVHICDYETLITSPGGRHL